MPSFCCALTSSTPSNDPVTSAVALSISSVRTTTAVWYLESSQVKKEKPRWHLIGLFGHDSDERKLIATYRSFFVVKGIRHSIFISFVESILGKAKSATRKKKNSRKRQCGKRDQNVKEGASGVESLTPGSEACVCQCHEFAQLYYFSPIDYSYIFSVRSQNRLNSVGKMRRFYLCDVSIPRYTAPP